MVIREFWPPVVHLSARLGRRPDRLVTLGELRVNADGYRFRIDLPFRLAGLWWGRASFGVGFLSARPRLFQWYRFEKRWWRQTNNRS